MTRKLFLIFSISLLIYMIWPEPGKISDFKALQDSEKSALAGDNIYQVPNVAAYFSENYREFVVPFYSKIYQSLNWLPFPPLRLNHPPEYSWAVIKKHTDSTYLEELIYPLKSSLFVNGFEPFYPDGSPKFWGSSTFDMNGHSWHTKTTLRFYPSGLIVRMLVWFGIIVSIKLLFKLRKKVFFSERKSLLKKI